VEWFERTMQASKTEGRPKNVEHALALPLTTSIMSRSKLNMQACVEPWPIRATLSSPMERMEVMERFEPSFLLLRSYCVPHAMPNTDEDKVSKENDSYCDKDFGFES